MTLPGPAVACMESAEHRLEHLFSGLTSVFLTQPHAKTQILLEFSVRSQLNGASKAEWQLCRRPAHATALAVTWEGSVQSWLLVLALCA